MKKLDKLILKSFIGPFILTFLVAVFILLLVYMMKYFDDFIGKNLGFMVFGELMGYFSINQIPMALPLAILVSSLMTYGKLGEHFELTAIKGSGISLLRVILPTFVFSLFLAFGEFLLGNHVVPSANLKAFSLLYDIKQTKPSLDLREGQFYNGIPKYSIKANKKYPDGISMKGVLIYDHTSGNGNTKVIAADSCRMYSFMGDRYLKMDLYDGNYYMEEEKKSKGKNKKNKDYVSQFVRTKFSNMDLVFSLASFDLNSTDKDLFADNRYMKGISSLTNSIDSMGRSMNDSKYRIYGSVVGTYKYHMGGFLEPPAQLITLKMESDSLKRIKDMMKRDSVMEEMSDGEDEVVDLKLSEKRTAIKSKSDSLRSIRKPIQVSPNMASTDKFRKEKPEKLTAKKKAELLDKKNVMARPAPRHSDVIPVMGASYSNPASLTKQLTKKRIKRLKSDSLLMEDDSVILIVKRKMDSVYQTAGMADQILSRAVGNARNIKTTLGSSVTRMKGLKRSIDSHVVEKYKKYAQAVSCIVMFLIGAPLGAIIKRGGLGFPVIISVFFFIIFYVLTSVGDKWAKSGVVDGMYAAWMANIVLLPVGLFFLKQARKDARLFDTDFYSVWIDKAKIWWNERFNKNEPK